jgi:hypothetical protein
VDALPDEIVVENVVVEDDLDANFGHQEVDFECLSMGLEEDPVLLTSSGLVGIELMVIVRRTQIGEAYLTQIA